MKMTENVKKIFRICCIYTTFDERRSIAYDFNEADTNHVDFELFKLEIGKCILTCVQYLLIGDADFIITPIGWSYKNCINDFNDLIKTDLSREERVELMYYLSCFTEEGQAEMVIKEGLVNEDHITEQANKRTH